MTESKLERLVKQQDRINARVQKERSKEAQKARKQDTQAKILLGQAVLNGLKANDGKADEIYRWCRDKLTDKDKVRLDAALRKPTVTVKLRGEDPQSVNSNQQSEKTTS